MEQDNVTPDWEMEMKKLWINKAPPFKFQCDFIREILNWDKIVTVAKDGWPLEIIKGKPVTNFIRRLLLTKYKTTYKEWRKKGGCKIAFS